MLDRLLRLFLAAGGQSGEPLCDRLPFPRRAKPSRAKPSGVVRLPLKSAILESEDTFMSDPMPFEAPPTLAPNPHQQPSGDPYSVTPGNPNDGGEVPHPAPTPSPEGV